MGCQCGDVEGSWLNSSVLCCCGACPVSPVPAPFWPLMPADLNPSDAPRDSPDSSACSPKAIHVPGSHSEIALPEKRLVWKKCWNTTGNAVCARYLPQSEMAKPADFGWEFTCPGLQLSAVSLSQDLGRIWARNGCSLRRTPLLGVAVTVPTAWHGVPPWRRGISSGTAVGGCPSLPGV